MLAGWIKLGIEPGNAARRAAESRNINAVARSLESATVNACRADCVILLDVIEHFENPLRLLAQTSSFACPRGMHQMPPNMAVGEEEALVGPRP
jgi:hypothetical protein